MLFLFWKALVSLVAFDLLCRCNFRRIYRVVRDCKVSRKNCSPGKAGVVCEAVNLACVWYPKDVLCLQRSAVTTYLLRKSGIAAQMVLGAQELPFKAHAWVEVSGNVINERADVHAIYRVWDRC